MRKFLLPEFLFTFTAFIVFCVGLTYPGERTVHVRDTHYIIPPWYISTAIATLLLLMAFIYVGFRRLNRPLNNVMSYLHWLLTLVPLITIPNLNLHPKVEHWHMSEELEYAGKINAIITLTLLVALVGQLHFLINITVALIRKKTVQAGQHP